DRTSGKVRWERCALPAKLEQKHGENSFSSATPATDGKYVWVAFLSYPDVEVVCYDMDGKEVWRKSPGKLLSRHGFCSSPVPYKESIILNGDQDADGYLVALEKTTGKERWRVDRPNKTRSYCTPVIVDAGGKTQLVMSGSKCVNSYNPDTGEELWHHKGPTEQYVASLVFTENLFFLTSGFPEYHLMAFHPDGTVAWHHPKLNAKEASYVPSPVAHGEYFFVVSDLGFAYCYEAKTGKKLWEQKLGKKHHASLTRVEDNIYCVSDA